MVTVAGRKYKQIFQIIPLYGDSSLILEGSEPKSGGKDIWSLDNFSRGEAFRKIFNTNMPKTYPVIDDYSNGNAMSLKTIDLTSPYYKSNSRLNEAIKSDIDKLAAFKGGEKQINGSNYNVGSINSRTLTVVIPCNSPQDRRNVVSSFKEYAGSKGVTLEIREYGKSDRYA